MSTSNQCTYEKVSKILNNTELLFKAEVQTSIQHADWPSLMQMNMPSVRKLTWGIPGEGRGGSTKPCSGQWGWIDTMLGSTAASVHWHWDPCHLFWIWECISESGSTISEGSCGPEGREAPSWGQHGWGSVRGRGMKDKGRRQEGEEEGSRRV